VDFKFVFQEIIAEESVISVISISKILGGKRGLGGGTGGTRVGTVAERLTVPDFVLVSAKVNPLKTNPNIPDNIIKVLIIFIEIFQNLINLI